MQTAKDSFYMVLRARLAARNPQRTVEIDGAARPAIVVAENEDASVEWLDTFVVKWGEVNVMRDGPSSITCEIEYATRGVNGDGLDRGRALAAMDVELSEICEPNVATRFDYSQTPPVRLETTIFWSALKLGATESDGDLLRRTALLKVFYFGEGR